MLHTSNISIFSPKIQTPSLWCQELLDFFQYMFFCIFKVLKCSFMFQNATVNWKMLLELYKLYICRPAKWPSKSVSINSGGPPPAISGRGDLYTPPTLGQLVPGCPPGNTNTVSPGLDTAGITTNIIWRSQVMWKVINTSKRTNFKVILLIIFLFDKSFN